MDQGNFFAVHEFPLEPLTGTLNGALGREIAFDTVDSGDRAFAAREAVDDVAILYEKFCCGAANADAGP